MMINFITSDFKSRIVILTLTVVLMSGVVSGAAILWNVNEVAESALQSRLNIESEIIISNIATSVLFDDAVTATEIISTFKADPSVLMVTLETENNKIFASYKNASAPEAATDNVLTLIKNIYFENEVIGILNLSASKTEIREQNVSSAIFVVAVLFVLFVIAAILVESVVRSLLAPLFDLHDVSERIAKTRDYTLRASVLSNDEVGQLSHMFNLMVEQIEQRDFTLEKKVRQRTIELEKLAEEFRYRAFHDNLTGLPNRALLNEFFEHSIEHARRNKNSFACLLLDLDNFKTINDTKGHEYGDELLIEVAERLKSIVRAEDIVCRLGGDEFVVLLENLTDSAVVYDIAEKILCQLNSEFVIKNERIRTGASIGGAVYPDHGDNSSRLKRHADVAMYRAKEQGKNRFCLFSEGMQEVVKNRLMIQNDLRPGIDARQFEAFLQPKVNPQLGKIVGCEALVRWNHPTLGFLTPNRFVPFAEEVGMIEEIDYFVVNECCRLQIYWRQVFKTPIPISFNLSGRHFHDLKIVEVLKSSIDGHGVDPSMLEVEITEAVLIQDPEKARKIVYAIRDLGLGISLDDFGTGYSSLNYLRTLPIDTVKLDRSFVSNITTDTQDRKLTRGIVSLAKGLDLKLIAEGVETESQMRTLQELGCSTMQGYYFSRPVSNQDFMHWCFKQRAAVNLTKSTDS